MKRSLFSILIRILFTAFLVLIIDNVRYNNFLTYSGSAFFFLFLFILIVLNPTNTFNLNKKLKKPKVIGIKVGLFFVELLCFFLFQQLLGPLKAIVFTQLTLHPVQSFILSPFFLKDIKLWNRLFLYPLPIIKEARWQLNKKAGAFLQKYYPSSRWTQKSLVNTSYFFRDTQEFVPVLLNYVKNQKTNFLRLLVTGCATGQEVYSVAIICEANNIDYEITAIDLSESAIAKARHGRYSFSREAAFNGAFRQTPLLK